MKFFLKFIILAFLILSMSSLKIQRYNRRKHHRKGFFGGIINGIKKAGSAVANTVKSGYNAVKSGVSAVKNAAVNVAKKAGNAVSSAAKSVDNAVRTAANNVIEKGKKVAEKIANKVNDAVSHGGGSWKTGFDCPSILIGTTEKNFNKEGKGTFFPAQIADPITIPEKLGLAFDMKKQPPSVNLKKVMFRYEKTNIWYIPFSYMSSQFKYVNPIGFKYIQGKVTNDKKETYIVRVHLPWKAVGWFINDDEGKKITQMLNKRKTEMQIGSNEWKVIVAWNKVKMNLDFKIPIRFKGEISIKNFRDGETLVDFAKFGNEEDVSGFRTQSITLDTSSFEGSDSAQFFIANYSYFTESIMKSGCTVNIFNGKKKVKTLKVPQSGDKSWPYWYVGQLFKHGLIIENELDPQKKKKKVTKRLRYLRRYIRRFRFRYHR